MLWLHCLLSGVLSEYPDELRPSQTLKFYDIVPISAKESPNDVEMVKLKLRNLLDVLHENEIRESENAIGDLENSFKEKGPALM